MRKPPEVPGVTDVFLRLYTPHLITKVDLNWTVWSREASERRHLKAHQQHQQQQQRLIFSPHGSISLIGHLLLHSGSFLGKILEMSNVQLSCSALERLAARRTFPLHRRTSVCRNLFGPVDHDELNREMKVKMREISERDQQRWNFNFEANTPLDGDYEWEEVPEDKTPAFYQDSVQNGRTRVPATPTKQKSPSESVLPESPRVDVLERLAVPESSSTPCPVEVNQENRTDKLNSGRRTHRQVPCVRRKRTTTTDNNTHITGKYERLKRMLSSLLILQQIHLRFYSVVCRSRPCATGFMWTNCFFFKFLTDFFVKRKRPADRKSNDVGACHLSKSPIPVEQTPRKRIRWRYEDLSDFKSTMMWFFTYQMLNIN